MTIWNPELRDGGRPRYVALADALAADIAGGRLAAGDRLPTHRALADALGIAIGTVTRGYAEAERRGLVRGEVGRGTFVGPAPLGAAAAAHGERASGVIDLSLNVPVAGIAPDLAGALRALAKRAGVDDLLRYQPHAGATRHRAAGAAWAARYGVEAAPEQVLVCAGAQHAMLTIFAARAKPGDRVLTEDLTYPGMKALAGLLHLSLEGVAMDAEGLRPDALADALARSGARFLYCMPTIHNPTGTVLTAARRRAISALARAHDLTIIEDDAHRFLVSDAPPPFARLAPERTYHIAGTSKAIAGGLRVAFVTAPRHAVEQVERSIWATTWMAAPLTAEIAATWIEDGTADRVAAAQRREAAARQALARTALGDLVAGTHPQALHLWLELPEPWRGETFARAARERGVAIAPAEVFAAGRGAAPHAVRLGLGGARDRPELERALAVVRDTLAGHGGASPAVL
ncbi:MAG: PLP-dependent aminotransferase family protein [Deltaproteobacteria bacterium]|nr:PLP-dependent aminotransferase family protein [Deltaproteobacteria bacterium]